MTASTYSLTSATSALDVLGRQLCQMSLCGQHATHRITCPSTIAGQVTLYICSDCLRYHPHRLDLRPLYARKPEYKAERLQELREEVR